ncbi:alpha/beta hydrolase [Synechococcus sp. GreenBA-s]|nr:alpha/beta hydrolase [Synechococcus sp. GreenBA-s]
MSHTAPHRPLVLVHGLWDTPRLFRRLEEWLGGRRDPLLIPNLPHGLGSTPLEELAERLGEQIEAAFGPEQELDLLGFSMGGVIGRIWIQLLGGHRRTRRFISVGSPQNGTFAAQPWPRWLLPGIADMKVGSPLIQRLNADLTPLKGLDCRSFWCPIDTMIVPPWKGVLPVGTVQVLPVANHRHLITRPEALGPIGAALLEP